MLPETRTRFVIDGARLRGEQLPLRPPGPAEVVLEVAGSALGVAPGAEVAGRVVAAGAEAQDWLGRRVVAARLCACGECVRCRRGRPGSCPARLARDGLASHETLPARALSSLEPPLWPAELPPSELWRMAALADAALAPYSALVRAGLAPGNTVWVLGDGPRARFALAIASALGARPQAVATDGPLPTPEPGAMILETSATAAAQKLALALCPDAGTIIFLDGGATAPVPAPIELLAQREAEIVLAQAGHPDLLPELCALLVRHALPLASLTEAIAPDAAGEALQARIAGTLGSLPILVPER